MKSLLFKNSLNPIRPDNRMRPGYPRYYVLRKRKQMMRNALISLAVITIPAAVLFGILR